MTAFVAPISFKLNDRAFNEIVAIIYASTGIRLKPHKKSLVISRLSKRLRDLNLGGFDEYVAYLTDEADHEQEMRHLINCITTNQTAFFREDHHFTILTRTILPAIIAQNQHRGKIFLRVWSAAASTGEEPYTIAMVLAEFCEQHPQCDFKVLGSDIDTNVLMHASRGVYTKERAEAVPALLRGKYFAYFRDNRHYKIKEDLRAKVIFRRINLVSDPFLLRNPVDIIFCRNILIYFDNTSQALLLKKFAQVQSSGGYLFTGHSESLLINRQAYHNIGGTVYQKI